MIMTQDSQHQLQVSYNSREPITFTGDRAKPKPAVVQPLRRIHSSTADAAQGQPRRITQFTQPENLPVRNSSSRPDSTGSGSRQNVSSQSRDTDMRSHPGGGRYWTNIQLNNFRLSPNTNREHIQQLGDPLNKNYNNLINRLQDARDSKDFSHIPGSKFMIKEMRSGREELCKLGGLRHDTNAKWHDIITEFQDKLEGQKIEQKRSEDNYKQNKLRKRKTISGIKQNDLPVLKDSIDFHLWDESVIEIMNALKEADSALAKHAIVTAIRKSLQGPQVINLSRMAASTSDLRTILR